MKKIFTFAAALMASVSLMAVEPTLAINTEEQGSTDFLTEYATEGITLSSTASFSSGAVQLGNTPSSYDLHYFEVLSATNAIDSISFLISGNGSNKSIQAPLFAWEETATGNTADTYVLLDAVTVTANSYAAAKWFTYNLSAADVKCARIYRTTKYVSSVNPEYTGSSTALGSGQTIKIYGIKVWLNGQAPVVHTDPVSEITIAGPTECYVGQKVTLKATTDVKADTIWWTDQYGTVQDSKKGVFEFTPDAEGTYTYTAWAENQYNTQPATLGHSVVVTTKPVLEQVLVTDHTTWDFTKAATVNQIKWEGDMKDAAPVVMANIDGFNNDANFNSQALLFSGEYPIRDGKYCQGPHLEFEIESPGLLTVVYSNTGNRSAAEGETEGQEALRRFLTINGNLVPGDEGSMKSSANTTTEGIAVQPGAVVISACMPYSEAPSAAQYIRIYKVVYQRTGWPTAVDNTETAVKAVKVIRNGQLLIEKNGILYNAQGIEIK